MRRAVLLVVVLGLTAAACAPDNPPGSASGATTTIVTGERYPAEMVEAYMDGCRPGGGEQVCRCTIEQYQTRFTRQEFTEFSKTAPDALTGAPAEIIDLCARGSDAGTATLGGFGPSATVEEVVDRTITDVDAFWAATAPALWGIEYTGPIVNGPYFPSRGDMPVCRGPMDPDPAPGGYCRIDDTVQWDQESMTSLYQHFGGFAVALVLAHEWGHAIQERLGFDDVSNPSIVSELQADCFAGAWAESADAGHSEIPRPDPGDLEAGMSGYFIGGSPDHGSSFDRLNAFFDGFGEGAGRCATYAESPPEIVAIPSLSTGDRAGGSDLSYEETAPRFVEALEAFWTATYPEVFGEEWVPVSHTTPYDPAGDNLPACDGYVGRAGFYEGNAYFCAADDFVAWDEVGLFPDLYAEIGDFAIGLVLADEWGKAVRVRAGLGGHEPETQYQADCLAGVFAAALVSPDNPMGLVMSAGDLDEGISGLLAMSATPDVERHARSPQRFEAFNEGFFEGIAVCRVALW